MREHKSALRWDTAQKVYSKIKGAVLAAKLKPKQQQRQLVAVTQYKEPSAGTGVCVLCMKLKSYMLMARQVYCRVPWPAPQTGTTRFHRSSRRYARRIA